MTKHSHENDVSIFFFPDKSMDDPFHMPEVGSDNNSKAFAAGRINTWLISKLIRQHKTNHIKPSTIILPQLTLDNLKQIK